LSLTCKYIVYIVYSIYIHLHVSISCTGGRGALPEAWYDRRNLSHQEKSSGYNLRPLTLSRAANIPLWDQDSGMSALYVTMAAGCICSLCHYGSWLHLLFMSLWQLAAGDLYGSWLQVSPIYCLFELQIWYYATWSSFILYRHSSVI